MIELFVYICVSTLCLELSIALYLLFKYLFQTDTKKYINQETFLICTKLLELLCASYKQLILNKKIEKLSHKYLNISGGTSKKLPPAYYKELNNLYVEAANIIITTYIADDVRDILFSYYGFDGLVMFVTTLLKG